MILFSRFNYNGVWRNSLCSSDYVRQHWKKKSSRLCLFDIYVIPVFKFCICNSSYNVGICFIKKFESCLRLALILFYFFSFFFEAVYLSHKYGFHFRIRKKKEKTYWKELSLLQINWFKRKTTCSTTLINHAIA